MTTSLADRLRAGPTMPCGWVSLPEPLVGELCIRAGFPAALVDMQHGQADLAAAFRLISGIKAAGGAVLVRVPVGEVQTASRLLDAGADAVVAPMIETVADAAAFGAFMKYPPLGTRSWGPTRAVQLAGGSAEDYRLSADARTLAIAMIETRRALDALDDILALPTIDGVFVGPADLSIALSGGARHDVESAENLAVLPRVAERARAAGKIAGIYAPSPAVARRFADFGFHFVCLMSDGGYLTAGAKAAIAEAGL